MVEDGPINTQTIEDTLKGIGVKRIMKDSSIIRFTSQDNEYWLEYQDAPTIHLGVSYFMEDAFNLELAKKTADLCNRKYMGVKFHIDDERWAAIKCMTFANGLHSFSEALPAMMTYLEEARLGFLYNYQQNLAGNLKLTTLQGMPS